MMVVAPACIEQEMPATRSRTGGRARPSEAVVVWGNGFLLSYMALHGLHVADRDPAVLASLSPIPLFACGIASTLTGAVFATAYAVFPRASRRARSLRVFALLVAAFTVEIALWP